MTDELQKYTESIQELLVAKNFSGLLEQLTKQNKLNNMFFSRNEHIILPGILKSDVKPVEDIEKLLLACLGVGRVRGDYFYTTIAAHFMKQTTATDQLKWIAKPLTIAIEEVPRHANWKLDAVLRVLNRRLDNIILPPVIDQERLCTDEIKDFEKEDSQVSLFNVFQLYENLIAFYTELIPALLSPTTTTLDFSEDNQKQQREERLKVLRCHVIRLLGYPIINLHYCYPRRKKSKSSTPTKAGEIVRKIIALLDLTGSSTDYFLQWLKEDESRLKKKDIDYPKPTNDLRCPGQKIDMKLNVEGVANYFYLVYCERSSHGLTSQREVDEISGVFTSHHVVSPKYVFETCLSLVSNLLSDPVNFFECIWKTLKLVQFLLDELKDEEPHRRLTTENLESRMFNVFVKHVINMTQKSEFREIQKLGKTVITSMLLAFDYSGSLCLLKKLFRQPENFEVVAHLVVNVGNFISDGIAHKQTRGQQHNLNYDIFDCFSGENLEQLFDSLLDCFHDKQNLIYYNDHIISILNVIRQLLVQDGHSNMSGFMNFFDRIRDKFLKPLILNLEHLINNRNFEEFTDGEEALFGSESQKIFASLDLVRITVTGLLTSYEKYCNRSSNIL